MRERTRRPREGVDGIINSPTTEVAFAGIFPPGTHPTEGVRGIFNQDVASVDGILRTGSETPDAPQSPTIWSYFFSPSKE